MKLFRKRFMIILLILCLAGLLVWTLWGNTALVTSQYTAESREIPAGFEGFRIAQISDLHNAEFGTGNEKLLALLKDTQPDLITITGDLVDSRKTNPEIAIAFVREAVKIAPVYYVSGNHESRVPEVYEALKATLSGLGAVVLENESVRLEKAGDSITLTGFSDPAFGIPWPELTAEGYQVVLSHRPEQFDWYVRQQFDLVFTGHAHGGQFRLPFVGGLVAPNQGIFPKYDGGLYHKDGTTMVVSRGLGNSVIPLRFNNRPELILVTLESI